MAIGSVAIWSGALQAAATVLAGRTSGARWGIDQPGDDAPWGASAGQLAGTARRVVELAAHIILERLTIPKSGCCKRTKRRGDGSTAMASEPPRLLALVLLGAPALAVAKCQPGTVTGRVSYVRDGELGNLAVRLTGLATPEWDTPAGAKARQAMIKLAEGRTVRCVLDGSRTHDRCAAICYLGGRDIAEAIVSEGLARDCPRYSGGRYHKAEVRAASAARLSERATPCRTTVARDRSAAAAHD